ncbi:MAG TPA: nuclear transport factor 2 family protein [Caulobacter sp.]|nr:nuclear transport factor 2 family protein [Caulobacter sp.]
MADARELVVRLHEAISRRDAYAAASLFHPQARFRNYLDEGEVVGPDGAQAFYRKLFETLAPNIDLLSVRALADGRAQAELQVSVHDRSGRLWSDSRVTATYTAQDGLIQNVDLGPDRSS